MQKSPTKSHNNNNNSINNGSNNNNTNNAPTLQATTRRTTAAIPVPPLNTQDLVKDGSGSGSAGGSGSGSAGSGGGMGGSGSFGKDSTLPSSITPPSATTLTTTPSTRQQSTTTSSSGKQPIGIELQSVLWKKGVLGSWHKCQFVLTTGRTLMYRRFNEEPSQGEWRTKSLEECVVKNAEGLTNRPFSFALFIGNKKTILLAADNDDVKNEWTEHIRSSSGHYLGKMKMLHLLEGMHECVVVSDERGIIIGFNKAAKKMFGYGHSEAVGKNVNLLMPQPYKNNHTNYVNRHNTTGVTHIIGVTRRVLGQRKDGSVFPLEIGLGKIHTHEGQTRFIATMREISTKSNTETLSLVDSAHSVIQTNLSTLSASVEGEFEKLRKRIMDLEHDNRDSESVIEGLRKKVEYHMRWREAAESVLRDKQREEIKKIIGKNDPKLAEDPILSPRTDSDDVADEQYQEFQLQTSLLIYPHMIQELHSWLPGPTKIKKPTLMFSTTMHGSNIRTFLARCNVSPNLMLLKTEQNQVFGGFFSHGWIRTDRYYGDGQCFLFTLLPRIKKFPWTPGNPTQFMMVSESYIVIGGGSKGHALWIDLDNQSGMTDVCETFDSDPLVANTSEPFKIDLLEVYGFF